MYRNCLFVCNCNVLYCCCLYLAVGTKIIFNKQSIHQYLTNSLWIYDVIYSHNLKQKRITTNIKERNDCAGRGWKPSDGLIDYLYINVKTSETQLYLKIKQVLTIFLFACVSATGRKRLRDLLRPSDHWTRGLVSRGNTTAVSKAFLLMRERSCDITVRSHYFYKMETRDFDYRSHSPIMILP